ncbi:MAG: hypothetical protein WBO49_02450 [Candidatus Saccharimonas sp.]
MATDVTKKMMEALSRLPRVDTREFQSQLHPEYDATHVALSITPATILFALHRAREARDLAVSYRNFTVGASIVALSIGSPRFQLLSGINVKPDEQSMMNVHAEQTALQKVDDRHYSAVSIVAVVGETQSDQQSGKMMHTLQPCGLCRNILAMHPCIHPENTLIVSALPSLETIEAYSVASLERFHKTGDRSGMRLFQFPELEILKPFTPGPALSAVRLSNLESDGEELWDAAVGPFSLEWRLKTLGRQ